MAFESTECTHPSFLIRGLMKVPYLRLAVDFSQLHGVYNIWSGQYYQQNAYDPKGEWGPAGSDTRHNISVTGVYDLPFGTGRAVGSNANSVVKSMLDGWRLSGAEVYYSEFPVTVSSPSHYSSLVNAFGGAARPNQLRPLKMVNRSINAYLGNRGAGHVLRSGSG